MMKGLSGVSHKALRAGHHHGPCSARLRVVTARCPAPLGQTSAVDAAAGYAAAQQQQQLQAVLRLASAVCYLPHPDKMDTGGEDAHFLSELLGGAVGVADGVGGWREEGVNPAEYSRSLMRHARAHVEQALLDPEHATAGVDPRGAMDVAHTATRLPGSSTACIIQLNSKAKTLVAANLGDSGFVVIRGGAVLTRSKPMQHHFDCPLQLGAYPEYVEVTDSAQQAELYEVPVQHGDIIVAGSDGLWDNTFDHEIIATVTTAGGVQSAADALAALARQHASDPDFASPYIGEALSQGFDLTWWEKVQGASFKDGRFQLRQLSGGKQDDITVIIAHVVEQQLPVQQPQAQPAEQLQLVTPEGA